MNERPPRKRVIDVVKIRQEASARLRRRRRLLVLLVLAVVLATLLFVVFEQFYEVIRQREFWDSFQGASSRAA